MSTASNQGLTIIEGITFVFAVVNNTSEDDVST